MLIAHEDAFYATRLLRDRRMELVQRADLVRGRVRKARDGLACVDAFARRVEGRVMFGRSKSGV